MLEVVFDLPSGLHQLLPPQIVDIHYGKVLSKIDPAVKILLDSPRDDASDALHGLPKREILQECLVLERLFAGLGELEGLEAVRV